MLVSTVLLDTKAKQNNSSRPTLCRNCGAIVGAGSEQCAVCGTSTAPPAQARKQPVADRETVRFARAVLNRPYKFTVVLLVLNLFVFLLMWDSSGLATRVLADGFPDVVLLTYGAKLNYLINAPNYQWWRFVTPMFIHINLLHVLVNMYSLWMLGPYVEKLYGSAKFTVFWVLTGIAGVVGSYLTVVPELATNSLARFIFKPGDGPSAGASGALFGLVGVLFVFGIKFRRELPEGFKRAFGTGMVPIIVINLVIGYAGRGYIDNAAHLGGLLSGAALAAFVQYRRPDQHSRTTTVWRVLQILALSIVVISFYKVVRNFNKPLPIPSSMLHTVDPAEQLRVQYFASISRAQEAVSALIHEQDSSTLGSAMQILNQTSVPDPPSAELRDRLVKIMGQMVESTAASGASKDGPRRSGPLDPKLIEEYDKWQKDYEAWLNQANKDQTTKP